MAYPQARLSPAPFTLPALSPPQDGYPRTVQQAKDLDAAQVRQDTPGPAAPPPACTLTALVLPSPRPQKVSRVINITLPEEVLMQKLLGRRVCGDCGKNYNVAAIHSGELDMPPLLPKPSDCTKCVGKPRLITRADDTEEVVRNRMVVYNKQTSPLIAYYSAQAKLQDFAVKKGIDDMPRLVAEMGIK